MTVQLTHVHEQRLRAAVEAQRNGGTIRFRVNPGEPQTIVWWREGQSRTQHAIANSFGNPKPLLQAIEQRFQEMTLATDTMRPQTKTI